ncbi:helix-turn-helix domain-containing protein [Paenibacillus sp. FSL K6-2524]|uniref:helix-turn-helix domain-containing protein n=1 Tax=Paenibacillus sp. FSL K6-2524 TaxID=2954516 RepID=UPI0030FB55E1
MSTTDFIAALKSEVAEDVFAQVWEKAEPLIKLHLTNNSFGIEEAAAYIGCSGRMLRELAKKGSIRYYKIGNEYRFRQRVLDEWMERQESSNCTGWD